MLVMPALKVLDAALMAPPERSNNHKVIKQELPRFAFWHPSPAHCPFQPACKCQQSLSDRVLRNCISNIILKFMFYWCKRARN